MTRSEFLRLSGKVTLVGALAALTPLERLVKMLGARDVKTAMQQLTEWDLPAHALDSHMDITLARGIIWDGLLCTDRPDLYLSNRMPPLIQIFRQTNNGNALWTDPATVPEDAAWYDSIASYVLAGGTDANAPRSNVIVFDYESWPVTSQAERLQASANFVEIVNGLRSRLPNYYIGVYGVVGPMLRDYFRATALPGDADYLAWQTDNDDFAEMYDVVDMLFPSVYGLYVRNSVFGPWNVAGLKNYVIQNILEQRRLIRQFGHGQLIYPFTWDFKGGAGPVPLDQDVYEMLFRLSYQYGDGAVIWGGFGETWAEYSAKGYWQYVSAITTAKRFHGQLVPKQ